METNPLKQLETFGQSFWLDYIRRDLTASGELRRLIEEDGLRGITSNPSIFEKAIAGSHEYDKAIRVLALEGKGAAEIYEAISQRDVQNAADEFRPLYDKTDGKDGFVSLEVNPHLARNCGGTIEEARRLWTALSRPNVFIKVPATAEGIPAIRQLISEGINVNVTLLFGLPRYRQVAKAYIAGIETRLGQGLPVSHVASVASFFVSRIDKLVDSFLGKMIAQGGTKAELAKKLRGQVAVASARAAYQIYKEIFGSARFQGLMQAGARVQRLLWASTGTKNPDYSDVKYIDALIGPDTVNTIPVETANAYREHGVPEARLEKDVEQTQRVLAYLPTIGIDIDEVTQQLEDEGVEKFNQPFDQLMKTLEQERVEAQGQSVNAQQLALGDYQSAVDKRLDALTSQDFSTRLWCKDASLWKADPKTQKEIGGSLGWLHVAEDMKDNLDDLSRFAKEVEAAGFRHVVHMGMGGSSLAPLVLARTCEHDLNGLPLTVLDTTDPATICELARDLPIRHTLFIIASKSGTTVEPLAFAEYFYARVKEMKGDRAGENFVAITDPETPLVALGKKHGFRKNFMNFRDIGGRYSSLSYFGLVPAALMGIDVAGLLNRALRMTHACATGVPVKDNPGVTLGVVIGELARCGRDKVTFLAPHSINALGMWLEQLLAESTGKEGKGLLPVAGEPVGAPALYEDDRLFIQFRVKGQVNQSLERAVDLLCEAGHPRVTIELEGCLDLGQEFIRWEIATATAGALLGINPFDQPNVQESKDNTNRLLQNVRDGGHLLQHIPSLEEGPLLLFAEKARGDIAATLAHFFGRAHPHDYVALQAYWPETPAAERSLEAMRMRLRDHLHVAVTVGYGPRFLHSTGQFHKGGPNTGLFLQLTCADPEDVPIPGESYGFGLFRQAQAQGDLDALRKHSRRVLHIHLSDFTTGLSALEEAIHKAMKEAVSCNSA